MINSTADKHNYKDRYCAFVDMLGFKSFVNSDSYTEVYSALQKFKVVASARQPVISATCFSDSVILSIDVKKEHALYTLTMLLFYLAINLVNHKVLLRGGVTRGKVFHDSEYVFGPGINKAHTLESKEALYPRIIFDRSLNDREFLLESMDDAEETEFLDGLIPKDPKDPKDPEDPEDPEEPENEYRYLNYLSPDFLHSELDDGYDATGYYKKLRDLTNEHKDSGCKNIAEKYKWLDRKLIIVDR
ncbi:hypothetical protein [Polynucleobacter sp.]|jgi:hypothetical protein|uniref:hypothetical protein n=1 Tax=Polynucleobacter sp. TaxID=2029855 RepID=UPI0037C6AC09